MSLKRRRAAAGLPRLKRGTKTNTSKTESPNISVESIEPTSDDSVIELDQDPTTQRTSSLNLKTRNIKPIANSAGIQATDRRSQSLLQDVTRRFSQSARSVSNSTETTPKKKKRKLDFTESFKETQKLEYSIDESIKEKSQSQSHITWVEKYAPTKSSQISIRTQKLDELRNKIDELINFNHSNRVLILAGPSGTGKSTAARLICEELMEEKMMQETKNKLDISNFQLENQEQHDKYKYVVEFSNLATSTSKLTSHVTYFSDFLEQCKLLTSKNERCIVVEDLPNLYHGATLKSFQNSLQNWICTGSHIRLPPLIICITEVDTDDDRSRNTFGIDNVFKVETVLGFSLLDLEGKGWERVKFLPVAKTYLKKALDRVVRGETEAFDKMKGGIVKQQVDSLSKNGDIRNAINMLEYWAKYFYSATSSSDLLAKESSLNFFHYLGKVIYGTQHPEEEIENFMKRANLSAFLKSNIPKNTLTKFVKNSINSISVENVSADIISVAKKFNLTLLETYTCIDPPNCEDRADLVDVLSSFDILSSFERANQFSDELATYYSCLGVRLKCEKLREAKSSSKAATSNYKDRLKFSRDGKVMRKNRQIVNEINGFGKKRVRRLTASGKYSHLSRTDTILIDGFYESNFLNSRRVRKNGNFKFLPVVRRLGGDFSNVILADTTFQGDDEEESQDSISKDNLQALEKYYLGEAYDDDGLEAEESSDDEFDLDPIVVSEDEAIEARKKLLQTLEEEDWDDWDESEDSFSDNSEVMKL